MSDYTEDDVVDIFSSVSIVIAPHKKGFTCGIIDPTPPAQRDICSYIAKGIVEYVTENPDVIYEKGIDAFYGDEIQIKEVKSTGNVIDLFKFKKGDLN